MAEVVILVALRRRQQGKWIFQKPIFETRSNQDTLSPSCDRAWDQKPDSEMASPAGLEPATLCLEGRCA